jgi:SAM-dependent methyltransferase
MFCSHPLQSLEMLLADEERVQELLEGSFHYNGTFATWTAARRFIATAIHKSGTILDIGCANGFLLRCLQEWSPYTLIPYGIDKDVSRVSDANKLFSSKTKQFANVTLENLERLKESGLPESFDFVYWNVWNNTHFDNSFEVGRVELTFKAVRKGGRLILGFYDDSAVSRETKIRRLMTLGFNISGRISNEVFSKEAIWLQHS